MSLNVEVLEQTFKAIEPRAEEFAISFYDNLFTDYPEARPLFANTEMNKQRKMLISSLVFVVTNLRNSEQLVNALKNLGARHVNYGTLSEHYPIVGSTLLKTFESYLGSMWTPEAQQAWTDAYGAIAKIMLDGAKKAE